MVSDVLVKLMAHWPPSLLEPGEIVVAGFETDLDNLLRFAPQLVVCAAVATQSGVHDSQGPMGDGLSAPVREARIGLEWLLKMAARPGGGAYQVGDQREHNLWVLFAAIGLDNVAGGFAGTCLIAYMSSLTSVGFTATQYALFSSLYAIPGRLIASQSGRIVEAAARAAEPQEQVGGAVQNRVEPEDDDQRGKRDARPQHREHAERHADYASDDQIA